MENIIRFKTRMSHLGQYPEDLLQIQLAKLKKKLIVLKLSGSLLIEEQDLELQELDTLAAKAKLDTRKKIVSLLTELSQNGISVFVVHGGQNQLDSAIKESRLDALEKQITKCKNAEIRLTPASLLPLVMNVSEKIGVNLAKDIINSGGDAYAIRGPLFYANRESEFSDADGNLLYTDSHFGRVPIDSKIKVNQSVYSDMIKAIRKNASSRKGLIIIGGFVTLNDKKTLDKPEPLVLNGDADNQAIAIAYEFSNKPILPVNSKLSKPEGVYLLEIAHHGGIFDPDNATGYVDLISSDAQFNKVLSFMGKNMKPKASQIWEFAKIQQKRKVPSKIKIVRAEEIVPSLLDTKEICGTTFKPNAL